MTDIKIKNHSNLSLLNFFTIFTTSMQMFFLIFIFFVRVLNRHKIEKLSIPI